MSGARGVLRLAWRRVVHDRWRSALLAACLAVPALLPLAAGTVAARWQRELVERADATPLVAGAKGSRFDLVLAALHFRPARLAPIPWRELEALSASGLAIPLHVGATARGWPLVGTSPEYFEHRGLALARGTRPQLVGDVVLGADVARELDLGVGDGLHSDPPDLYDLARPPTLALRVVGVLAPSGGPDDRAAFADVATSWAVDGLLHGHAPAEAIDDALVLGRAEGRVALSGAVLEHQDVTPETLRSFHAHGERGARPLTAVLLVPPDARAGTIAASRTNASAAWQMVRPRAVVDELLDLVLRVKALVDGVAAVLGACTVATAALVVWLSLRTRARETETLHRLGCGRGTIAAIHAAEVGIVLALSLALAGAGAALAVALLPDVSRLLGGSA